MISQNKLVSRVPSGKLTLSAHRGLTQWAVVTSLSLSVIQAILSALSSAPTCCQQLLLRNPSCQTKAQPSQTQITDCPMLAAALLMLASNPHKGLFLNRIFFMLAAKIKNLSTK